MAHVRFTPHLSRFFPELAPTEVQAANVAEVLSALEGLHPGIAAYLVDDRGALRQHVNVFVESRPVQDRDALSDAVSDETKVFIMQALSGG